MAQQNGKTQTPQKKLTKDESELRNKADLREAKQKYINTVVLERLKLSHAWFMEHFIYRSRCIAPLEDHHPISPWNKEWNDYFEKIANTETSLHPIPYHHPGIEILDALQLPITGDDIYVKEITQDNKQTSTYQDELNQIESIRQKLVFRCQEAMRNHYHAQDPKAMPRIIKMTALNKLTLGPLDQGKYFSETNVLVEVDSNLGDNVICE